MRKLNNKGFAISTLIYGLAIMGIMIVAILMATMAQTRSNTRTLVKTIEEDLNRYSRTETTFKPITETMTSQEYIVPTSGWYKIELWGAQGGGNGGRGAYTGGVIELVEGDTLYFYVGKHRSSDGGYTSEVRVVNGDYESITSYETRIMVAAGGGSETTALGGTLRGYNSNMNSFGGFIDTSINGDFSLLSAQASGNNTNGTLIGANKNYVVSTSTNPQEGVIVPSPVGSHGGGDGYFPSNDGSTGGSSFIAGYAGNYGISKGYTTLNSMLEYYEHFYEEIEAVATHRYADENSGEYYFVDGVMLPGVNEGDGYAKIERVRGKTDSSIILPRTNDKLTSIRYIRDCVIDYTASDKSKLWNKAIVTVKGTTTSIGPTSYDEDDSKPGAIISCATFDLGRAMDIDELAIIHKNPGTDYLANYTKVRTEPTDPWIYIKKATIAELNNYNIDTEEFNEIVHQKSETETITGYRYSAYQNDQTTYLPLSGTYIIMPVLSENKVLTASENSENSADPITLDYYKGEKRQKWAVEVIRDKKINSNYDATNGATYEYKIVELARYKALAISQDENLVHNTVSAMDKFNDKRRNEPQIWKITPVGDGTYTISTVVSSVSGNTGNLVAQTNPNNDNYNTIVIGKNNKATTRFKFIKVDYSSN